MGKILLVVSDKGGVGKSTYVANTGINAGQQRKVGNYP
jgi:MinD-like ATPase involved in chromosome partitioning or flagellar assembly